MPTADTFTALGAGNGFPFCIQHKTEGQIANIATVNTLQRWLRLNGTLEEMMAIYWNLYSLTASGDISILTPASDSFSNKTAYFNYNLFFNEYEIEYGFEPEVDPQSIPRDRCVFNDSLFDIGYEFEPFPPANTTRGAIVFKGFYYNTTSSNYSMLFEFNIEIKSNFGSGTQYSDFYTSNEAEWGGSISAATFTLFGESYTIYSTGGQISLTNFEVEEEYFSYS
jgi:hypothetical protein